MSVASYSDAPRSWAGVRTESPSARGRAATPRVFEDRQPVTDREVVLVGPQGVDGDLVGGPRSALPALKASGRPDRWWGRRRPRRSRPCRAAAQGSGTSSAAHAGVGEQAAGAGRSHDQVGIDVVALASDPVLDPTQSPASSSIRVSPIPPAPAAVRTGRVVRKRRVTQNRSFPAAVHVGSLIQNDSRADLLRRAAGHRKVGTRCADCRGR